MKWDGVAENDKQKNWIGFSIESGNKKRWTTFHRKKIFCLFLFSFNGRYSQRRGPQLGYTRQDNLSLSLSLSLTHITYMVRERERERVCVCECEWPPKRSRCIIVNECTLIKSGSAKNEFYFGSICFTNPSFCVCDFSPSFFLNIILFCFVLFCFFSPF